MIAGKPTVEPEPTPPIDDAAFAEAHRTMLADRSIQFELPVDQLPEPRELPGWLRWLVEFLASDHPVLQILFWTIIAAAVLLLLWLVARRLAGAEWPWRRGGDVEEGHENWRPEEKRSRELLQEADALAAQGRFSEAARLLLFRSIEDLESRRPGLVRPAFTSRDIAGLPAIPSGPRGAFARIAMLVERGLFAKRPLAEGDWDTCRTAYESFAFAEGWRG